MNSHISRLEAQIEAYGQNQTPIRRQDSVSKATFLICSLPCDSYWSPFVCDYAEHFNTQLKIEIDRGVPHYITWEELVPQVLAHERARPFWMVNIPRI